VSIVNFVNAAVVHEQMIVASAKMGDAGAVFRSMKYDDAIFVREQFTDLAVQRPLDDAPS
jgi:hypothetical protein